MTSINKINNELIKFCSDNHLSLLYAISNDDDSLGLNLKVNKKIINFIYLPKNLYEHIGLYKPKHVYQPFLLFKDVEATGINFLNYIFQLKQGNNLTILKFTLGKEIYINENFVKLINCSSLQDLYFKFFNRKELVKSILNLVKFKIEKAITFKSLCIKKDNIYTNLNEIKDIIYYLILLYNILFDKNCKLDSNFFNNYKKLSNLEYPIDINKVFCKFKNIDITYIPFISVSLLKDFFKVLKTIKAFIDSNSEEDIFNVEFKNNKHFKKLEKYWFLSLNDESLSFFKDYNDSFIQLKYSLFNSYKLIEKYFKENEIADLPSHCDINNLNKIYLDLFVNSFFRVVDNKLYY